MVKTKPEPKTVPVLLPLALPAAYDYLVPKGMKVEPGQFVVAPLGTVEYLGVVLRRGTDEPAPKIKRDKLKAIVEAINDVPKLPPVSLDFLDWVSRYTLAPPGMVLRMMMSAGRAFDPPAPRYGVRFAGDTPSRMTPARARVIEQAKNGLIWTKSSLAEAAGVSTGVIDGLVDTGSFITEPLPDWHAMPLDLTRERAKLTPEQAQAATGLVKNTNDGFTVTLLDGVTGSGKTEVYFEAIAQALKQGKQALVLMPEIALTSQFIARCQERFGAKPAEWHSGMTSATRGRVWRAVAENKAKLVVGARSSLFLPFPNLGLIVVDEEHDQSYKQEDRVAYQARDMAVLRGSLGQIPVVLSSATPSIESLVNVEWGRYRHVRLAERYKNASLPDIKAIDMRKSQPERGRFLSPALIEEVTANSGPRRAGAAVSQSPRLCAGHALPEMRLQIRMSELLGLAGRAPLPANGSNATIAASSLRFPRSARNAARRIRWCHADPASSASPRKLRSCFPEAQAHPALERPCREHRRSP